MKDEMDSTVESHLDGLFNCTVSLELSDFHTWTLISNQTEDRDINHKMLDPLVR